MTVESASVGRYSQEVEAAVYFCALEAMNNLAKYARASAATVSLATGRRDAHVRRHRRRDRVPALRRRRGNRPAGMADRLDAIGGSLEVRSEPGQGTSVRGRVPVGD
jgi:signal transduction histidine kinase